MKAKEIILLIFIIIVGIIFFHAQTGKIHFDNYCGDGFIFFCDEFEYEESQEINPPFPPELQVINAHGDVEIQGTEEENITVVFVKKIWRRNEELAKEISDKLNMSVNKGINELTISTNRNNFKLKNFKTSFRLFIPEGMNVKVKNSYGIVKTYKLGNTNIINRHGKVIASKIDGNIFVRNSYEDVEVENVQSDCRIESSHSSLTAKSVKGNTHIIHRYGTIHLEDFSQDVTVEGSHNEVFGQNLSGTVEIENSYEKIILLNAGPTKIIGNHSYIEINGIDGDLGITDRYSNVRLNNIHGNLAIDGKSLGIYGNTISGDEINISSSYNDIELDKFSGKTTILLSHGKSILRPSPLTQPIEVKGTYVNIIFHWPSEGKYPVEAQNKGGNIKWELPFEPTFRKENSLSIIKAFTDEKENPRIFLSTSYGSIRILEED